MDWKRISLTVAILLGVAATLWSAMLAPQAFFVVTLSVVALLWAYFLAGLILKK